MQGQFKRQLAYYHKLLNLLHFYHFGTILSHANLQKLLGRGRREAGTAKAQAAPWGLYAQTQRQERLGSSSFFHLSTPVPS